MTIFCRVSSGLLVAVMFLTLTSPVCADRKGRGRDDGRYRERGYVLDERYKHNRYYPKSGHVVKELPRTVRVTPFRNRRYYYDDGVWYLPSAGGFIVGRPPVGLVVSVLPRFYTTVWFGGIPYYYAGGIYYVWHPEERAYVVSAPLPESEVVEQPATPEQLFIYPKEGQREEQQATDRYECHRWAVDQTGFDPSKPGGNVPESQYGGKRGDYQRGMKACLEARAYSVQ